MKRRVVFGLGMAAAVAAAAGLRLSDLGRRPMHTDEAVQAEKTRLLVRQQYLAPLVAEQVRFCLANDFTSELREIAS